MDARLVKALVKSGNWDPDQRAIRRVRGGCLDAHLISQNVIRTYQRIMRRPIHTAFVDFRKAYDSLSHEALLEILTKMCGGRNSASQRWLNTLKSLMKGWHTKITNVEGELETIPIKRGIFQGDKIVPTLLGMALSILRANNTHSVEASVGPRRGVIDKMSTWTTLKYSVRRLKAWHKDVRNKGTLGANWIADQPKKVRVSH